MTFRAVIAGDRIDAYENDSTPRLFSGAGAAIVGFCGAGFIAFWAYSKAVNLLLQSGSVTSTALLSGILALSGIGLGYRQWPVSFSILLRGIIIVFLFYAAAATSNVTSGAQGSDAETLIAQISLFHYAALASGCIALIRPTFALPLLLYVFATKFGLGDFFGFPISSTDYIIVMEFGQFVVLSILILYWALFLTGRFRAFAVVHTTIRQQSIRIVSFIVLMGIAAHFANYFWSAHEKLILDGGVTSWVLENPTHYLILNSKELGLLPLLISDWLTDLVFWQFGNIVVAANIFTLTIQLLSVVALWRWRWVVWLTLLYDVMHVVIFLTTGIFFWKWIVLNTLVIIAIRRSRPEQLGPAFHGLACCFVLFAELLFTIAHLGWYDTNAVNHVYFEAITEDRKSYEVPTNYFLAASITAAQQRVGRAVGDVLPTGGLGITKQLDMVKSTEQCERRLLKGGLADPDNRPGSKDQLAEFLRNHHAYILSRVDENGRFEYDLYPHHIWSNPMVFNEFRQLDKRRIVAYRWVVDGVCFDIGEGKVDRRVLGRFEEVIGLDSARY